MGQLRRQRRHLVRGHVGRIGNDGVERPVRGIQRRQHVALAERHPPVHAMPPRIAPGHLQRRIGYVRGRHASLGIFASQRHRDAAAARADVTEIPGPVLVRKRLQHGLDQVLRLRPGHEHVLRHRKRTRPELLLAQDVGQRLARRAALHPRIPASGNVFRQRRIAVRHQPGPRAIRKPGHHRLRLQHRRIAARRAQPGRRQPQRLADGHASPWASSSAWWWAMSASTSSSMSPFKICSSL